MQLFEELKRRNVFRVALAYLVAAWLLLQVIDIVSDVLELPAWTPKLILLLLAVGFVFALIVSWAYEITPEGLKKEKDVDRTKSITNITAKKLDKVTIALLLLVIALVVVDRNYQPAQSQAQIALSEETTSTQQTISAASTLPQALLDTKSVAVIPFANRSNKEDDKFFTDGIHDDLLTHISRIKDLKVISRTSVMKYRNSELTIPQIAQELGVGAILEGGVQRAGDRIRVNVQLIDANTDQHIWAEIYDHTLTVENLFSIQSQITEAIAAALKAKLSDTEKELIADVPTQSLEAYDLYLLGRQYFHQRSPTSLPKAIEFFEQAIELDPNFGLAYSGLADSYALIFQYANFDPETAIPKSYENAQKAVELAPEMAESWASLGLISAIRQERMQAFEYYKKAIDINPNYSMAYVWLGNGYANNSQYQMALQTFEKNYEIDPAHPLVMENLIDMYLTTGDYENAEKFIRRSLKLEPDFILTYPQVIRFYSSKGNLVDAYKVARYAHNKAPDSPVILQNYIDLETNLGNYESAQYLINKMKSVASRSSRGAITEVMLAVERGRPSDEVLVELSNLREKFRQGPPSAFLDQMKAYILFKQQKYSDSLDAHPQSLPFKGMKFFGAILKALSHRSLDNTEAETGELAKARVIVNEEQEQEAVDEFAQVNLALMFAAEGNLDESLSTLNIAFDRGFREQGNRALWPLFEAAFRTNEEAAQRFYNFKQRMLEDINNQRQVIAFASKQCNETPDNCPLDTFSLKPD